MTRTRIQNLEYRLIGVFSWVFVIISPSVTESIHCDQHHCLFTIAIGLCYFQIKSKTVVSRIPKSLTGRCIIKSLNPQGMDTHPRSLRKWRSTVYLPLLPPMGVPSKNARSGSTPHDQGKREIPGVESLYRWRLVSVRPFTSVYYVDDFYYRLNMGNRFPFTGTI